MSKNIQSLLVALAWGKGNHILTRCALSGCYHQKMWSIDNVTGSRGVTQTLYWMYWQYSLGRGEKLLLTPAVAQSGYPVFSCFSAILEFFPQSLLEKRKG